MSAGKLALGDVVGRRAMFVLELIDPVTGAPAGAEMVAKAQGLRAPSLTRAGQYVWLDVDPPAARSIKVSATARRNQFANFEAVLSVSMRRPRTPPDLIRRELRPTGLYEPPAGRLAAAGMLIRDAAAREPVVGAEIALAFASGAFGGRLRSRFVALSDERGGFVAVAAGLGAEQPQSAPRPSPEGSVAAWLEISFEGATRRTADLALRQSRLTHLADPLVWRELTP